MTTSPGLLTKNDFLLRRLHSLTGVVPVGAYLFPHLTTNASIVWGAWLTSPHVENVIAPNAGVETFQHEVNFIHSLPALVLIEMLLIWLPLAFHAIAGIWISTTGRGNVGAYPYGSNWRYTLQRLTGYVGVLFIFMHITSLRFGWTYFGLLPSFDPQHAASTTAIHLQANIINPIFYAVGMLALVYHFANGLWTAAITWGLTVSVPAQRRWGYVCAAIGVGLGVAGVLSIIGFTVLDPIQAEQIESIMSGSTH